MIVILNRELAAVVCLITVLYPCFSYGASAFVAANSVGTSASEKKSSATISVSDTAFTSGKNSDPVVFDQIVIGAGIVGLWIANELSKAGQKVLIIEQFPRCHHRGASAGISRAMELTFPFPSYIPTFKQAMGMYEDLQRETGVPLIKETKVLLVNEEPFEETPMPEIMSILEKEHGIKLPHLQWYELADLFPGYGFTEDSHAIYDNVTAKEVLASSAIFALWKTVEERGVKTEEVCPVDKVIEDTKEAGLLRVSCTTGRSFMGKTVVLATGAWTPSVQVIDKNNKRVPLPEVVPVLWNQFYFKKKPDEKCADVGFMDFQWREENPEVAWGRPAYNTQTDFDFVVGTGKKIDVPNPSYMDSPVEFQQSVDKARSYVRRRMPCLDDGPTLVDRAIDYRVVSPKASGPRPLEGIDNVFLAVEGNYFSTAPPAAKDLAVMILNGTTTA